MLKLHRNIQILLLLITSLLFAFQNCSQTSSPSRTINSTETESFGSGTENPNESEPAPIAGDMPNGDEPSANDPPEGFFLISLSLFQMNCENEGGHFNSNNQTCVLSDPKIDSLFNGLDGNPRSYRIWGSSIDMAGYRNHAFNTFQNANAACKTLLLGNNISSIASSVSDDGEDESSYYDFHPDANKWGFVYSGSANNRVRNLLSIVTCQFEDPNHSSGGFQMDMSDLFCGDSKDVCE